MLNPSRTASNPERNLLFFFISFGIVAVGPDNKMPASDILSIADERMYENKRMRKKERKTERENKI